MKKIDLIIKHLNTLQYKHQQEKDLLIDMKKKPLTDLHEAEIDINIDYLDKEIKEIIEIVEILEKLA